MIVNSRTAEFIKYANNSIIAAQISLSNELSNLARSIGDVDMIDVAREFILIIDGVQKLMAKK